MLFHPLLKQNLLHRKLWAKMQGWYYKHPGLHCRITLILLFSSLGVPWCQIINCHLYGYGALSHRGISFYSLLL